MFDFETAGKIGRGEIELDLSGPAGIKNDYDDERKRAVRMAADVHQGIIKVQQLVIEGVDDELEEINQEIKERSGIRK